MATFAKGAKVKWAAAGRRAAGSGTFNREETSGEGRARKTFAIVDTVDGQKRIFPSQLSAD